MFKLTRTDPTTAALKQLRRDAQKRVNRSVTRDESEQASADWHQADIALNRWRNRHRAR